MQGREELREEQGAVSLGESRSVPLGDDDPEGRRTAEKPAVQPVPQTKKRSIWDTQLEDVPPAAFAAVIVLVAAIIIVMAVFRVKSML